MKRYVLKEFERWPWTLDNIRADGSPSPSQSASWLVSRINSSKDSEWRSCGRLNSMSLFLDYIMSRIKFYVYCYSCFSLFTQGLSNMNNSDRSLHNSKISLIKKCLVVKSKYFMYYIKVLHFFTFSVRPSIYKTLW